ncbi:Nudix hydrolase 14 [Diplonema papillatum]|nr:Nudix hydrolase 14 [Diplonema papillatum]
MEAVVSVSGRSIPVSGREGADWQMVLESSCFKNWVQRVAAGNEMNLDAVAITGVDYPTVPQAAAGFVHTMPSVVSMRAHCTKKNVPTQLPGSIVLRGESVTVLPLLRANEGTSGVYAAFVVNPCVPHATGSFVELPRGIFDPTGQYVGAASQELKRVGLTGLHATRMKKLKTLFASPAVSDDSATLYVHETTLPEQELEALRLRYSRPERKDDTIMTLFVVDLSSAWRATTDARSLAALAAYEHERSD